jgi:hypothetical protein
MIEPSALKFHIARNWLNGKVSLFLVQQSLKSDRFAVATNITFRELPANEAIPDDQALLSLTKQEAQDLADQLYAIGVRPSLAAGSAGQLDAVKYHLEDMRTLVLGKGGAK